MFTTTISLTPEVHQKLKHLAVDLGVPFRDLVREALEGLLGQHKEKGGSRSRHEPVD
jgi:predicted DNA-binding protein